MSCTRVSRDVFCLCLAAFVALSPLARAQGQLYDYATGVRATRMWVPPGLATVKGVLIYGNGAGGDDRAAATVPWLQQFAQLHDFALIGTSMWGNLAGNEILTWDVHLAALATQSAHTELVNAPWAPIGFSNGGQMSYGFNALRPEKTIAFITNKGCCYNNLAPSAAALKTPGILIAGELDTALRRDNISNLYSSNRRRGALWSWVEQEGMAHEGLSFELMMPFMEEAIRLRYPAGAAPTATSGVTLLPVNEADGWLTDQSTWKSGLTKIADYNDYPGNKPAAGWLLNDKVAAVYRAFSTYGHAATLEFAHTVADPNPWPFGAYFSYQTPTAVELKLDVAALAGWTKIELLNYAASVLTITPSSSLTSELTLQAPVPRPGVYAFSALVTLADGVTLRTSNPLVFTAVPEPHAMSLLLAAIVAGRGVRRRFAADNL